jgi:hypothetical protein
MLITKSAIFWVVLWVQCFAGTSSRWPSVSQVRNQYKQAASWANREWKIRRDMDGCRPERAVTAPLEEWALSVGGLRELSENQWKREPLPTCKATETELSENQWKWRLSVSYRHWRLSLVLSQLRWGLGWLISGQIFYIRLAAACRWVLASLTHRLWRWRRLSFWNVGLSPNCEALQPKRPYS